MIAAVVEGIRGLRSSVLCFLSLSSGLVSSGNFLGVGWLVTAETEVPSFREAVGGFVPETCSVFFLYTATALSHLSALSFFLSSSSCIMFAAGLLSKVSLI